jgi:hypothetical protein
MIGTSRVCHDLTIMTADSLGRSAVRDFTAAKVVSQCRPIGATGGNEFVVDPSAASKIDLRLFASFADGAWRDNRDCETR